MDMREFLAKLDSQRELLKVKKQVDSNLEMAAVINAAQEKPILFENIKKYSDWKVCAGLCSTKEIVAKGLGMKPETMLLSTVKALENPVEPKIVDKAPCQEIVVKKVDLDALPILTHFKEDGGKYTTTSIAVIKDPDTGRNISYHRLMPIAKNKFVGRFIENRQTWKTFSKLGKDEDLEIAICIGNNMATLWSASLGPPPGVDELSVANAISKTPTVKCKTNDLYVPANAELVIEGRLTHETAKEGSFVDLTNTRDIVREQNVIEVDCVTHRKNPIYQVLLPGQREHKLLMGMPKEPTIYQEVNKVCKCKNVYITPGGCSWLHAIVQIEKKNADDGMKAIEAAYKGHGSLKNVVVVDETVDLFDLGQVERAIATRVQPDKNLKIMLNAPGSSLDPSAHHEKGKKTTTGKIGVDATATGKAFKFVEYPKVKLGDYL